MDNQVQANQPKYKVSTLAEISFIIALFFALSTPPYSHNIIYLAVAVVILAPLIIASFISIFSGLHRNLQGKEIIYLFINIILIIISSIMAVRVGLGSFD